MTELPGRGGDPEEARGDSDSAGVRLPAAARPPACALAVETSWSIGSVAIAIQGSVAARRFLVEPREHGARLVPAVAEVLEEAGAKPGDLDAVVAGAGPGSFTGVRTGAAVAKGLAAGLGVPLYATSSLAAAACAPEALEPGAQLPPEFPGEQESGLPPDGADQGDGALRLRYVLFDARGGRVYGACYDVGVSGPVEVMPAHGGTVVDVVNRRPPAGTAFVGEGAAVHEKLLRAAGHAVAPPPAGYAVADAVLRCCDWTPVDVAGWEPSYVRQWWPG